MIVKLLDIPEIEKEKTILSINVAPKYILNDIVNNITVEFIKSTCDELKKLEEYYMQASSFYLNENVILPFKFRTEIRSNLQKIVGHYHSFMKMKKNDHDDFYISNINKKFENIISYLKSIDRYANFTFIKDLNRYKDNIDEIFTNNPTISRHTPLGIFRDFTAMGMSNVLESEKDFVIVTPQIFVKKFIDIYKNELLGYGTNYTAYVYDRKISEKKNELMFERKEDKNNN